MQLPSLTKTYRADLNGLRAIAVLLVLLYHLDISLFKGGFLGVDVFFVLSGYFISRNILFELQEGSFRFSTFYTKRLKRLFPALLFVILLVVVLGYFLLLPAAYERVGKSAIFASLSASNFFFWYEAGYFDLGAKVKPLLHMWSLSIEEQFYLVWPALLVLFYKKLNPYLFWAIALISLLSLGFAQWLLPTQASAVFFLLPFRVFEFAAGFLCIFFLKVNRKAVATQSIWVAFGLLVMLLSSILLGAEHPMPGVLSLGAVLGTCLIVVYGQHSKLSSVILGNKLMEGIGKASYSIYLIHWPLIVFYKIYKFDELSDFERLLLFVGSLLFGFLMWHFIENTFRYSKSTFKKIDVVWWYVPLSIIVILLLSLGVWNNNGFPERYPQSFLMTQKELLANTQNYWKEVTQTKKILEGNPDRGHLLVLGNSHSIDIIYALRTNGFEGPITALLSSHDCYDFGMSSIEKKDESTCTNRFLENLQHYQWEHADAIILHESYPKVQLHKIKVLLDSIRAKTKNPIYLLGPRMTYKKQVHEIVAHARSQDPIKINAFAEDFQNRKERLATNTTLKREFSQQKYATKGIYFIDVLALQGGQEMNNFRVISEEDLSIHYFDGSHLTKEGSKQLGKKLKIGYPEIFQPRNK